MGRGAVRHVSVRVPWHDSGWNGRVCQDPRANAPCLALKRNAENRDDAYEASHAGKCFSELDQTPPCLAERGTFLSPNAFTLRTQLDYSRYSDDHKHILPENVHIPAYGGVLTPYRWLLRESAWQLAETLGLDADEGQEPQEGHAPKLIVDTPWVQNADNQRALLDGFRRDLSEQDSLVFFYAKQTPLTDSPYRQIVAVAKLSTFGHVAEYPYEGGAAGGRLRSMIWERPFQHSLRPHPDEEGSWLGGVVLPYHQLLAHAEIDPAVQLEQFVAEVPTEAYDQFLYASEHVTHGSAITALQAVRTSIEKAAEILPGPWARYIDWIDGELSSLWSMQGPAPGLGSALSCFDPTFNSTLFAHALAAELEDGADPWPVVEAIFEGSRPAPTRAPKITTMHRMRWQHLCRDAESYALMRLLACFELTKDQALDAFNMGDAATILANPYALFENSRHSTQPISLTTIDRSLFPSEGAKTKPLLPDSVEIDLDEPDHPLRLRAIAVEALERSASAGHTILSAERLTASTADLPLSRPANVDAVTLDICRDLFEPEVKVVQHDKNLFAQLHRYQTSGELIRSHVGARVEGSTTATLDWKSLVQAEFKDQGGVGVDEMSARAEKVVALETLEKSRIGILTGPAGTGKTTLLKIFLNQPKVVGRDILLLAPTGKARVRLGQQTGRQEQARTLAQFLLEHGRYDGETGRYFAADDGQTASVTTCVIDESSMLTEDQLAALCSVLPKSARLILVGDPQQLPPIGAGRPFVDIISYLREEHSGLGLAELTISRRQAGNSLVPALSLPDVQLANLFSGRSLEPGEGEVIASAGTPADSDRLRFVSWDTPAALRDRILDVLASELEANPEELEAAIELSLGGTPNGEYIYFNRGSGERAEAWQILSAHRNLASGSAEINRFLKQTVRRDRLEAARKPGRGWRMIKPRGADQITYGDKVICLRNHRRKRWSPQEGQRPGYLANGEVGVVIGDAGRTPRFTQVEFASQKSETFSFREKDFSEEGSPFLELAYAVTVHKAQGSEFGTVILVVPEKSQLLSREMLYTALTRQKERVWILHQGPFGQYLRLRSDFFSETRRRSTNLFGAPLMFEATHAAAGGVRSGWLAEKLIHATRRGDLVSSKSELVIADILYELERKQLIRYSFEKPLTDAEGRMRLPDFTIEKGPENWFWEHCGMLSQPQYAERWAKKLDWYKEQGITVWSEANPNGRLIVTVDTPDGGLDSGAIHDIAERLFG